MAKSGNFAALKEPNFSLVKLFNTDFIVVKMPYILAYHVTFEELILRGSRDARDVKLAYVLLAMATPSTKLYIYLL